MILEKSHGKEKRYAARDITEAVLQRGTVPGASGVAALAERVCLSQMWVPSQKRLSNGRYQCAQSYLDEYSFRFSSRNFGPALLERLTLAVSLSRPAEQKG